jgi:transcriptional regulator of acetoin/glycerol metabolism
LTPELLFATLQESGWNRSEAARRLGIDRSTLWRKMKKWALEVPGNDQDKGRFN